MESVVFENEMIENHPFFSTCGSTLNEISRADYPEENYFNPAIKCLAMDDYETINCEGDNNMTMDAVIGISDYDGRRSAGERLLLTELRMGYNSPNSLEPHKLLEKNRHTRELLGNAIRINDKSFFIFKDCIIEKVIRWFKDHQFGNSELKNCEPLAVGQFKDVIKDKNDLTYIAEVVEDDVKDNLEQVFSKGSIHIFCESVRYWVVKANKYHYSYKLDEYRNIMAAVKSFWKNFRESTVLTNEDDELEVEILEEDFPGLK